MHLFAKKAQKSTRAILILVNSFILDAYGTCNPIMMIKIDEGVDVQLAFQ